MASSPSLSLSFFIIFLSFSFTLQQPSTSPHQPTPDGPHDPNTVDHLATNTVQSEEAEPDYRDTYQTDALISSTSGPADDDRHRYSVQCVGCKQANPFHQSRMFDRNPRRCKRCSSPILATSFSEAILLSRRTAPSAPPAAADLPDSDFEDHRKACTWRNTLKSLIIPAVTLFLYILKKRGE
ncbi:hypothetical protein TorRG33x02_297290 [Trema orientale]|uniref:Transmembrane protein n=1 Tax=Trema orientale TaxID=63057 RepID=A0A2P5C4T9_TREOI|nr:hypothetical protein TorRG33x02_297290 [Trema orientale]